MSVKVFVFAVLVANAFGMQEDPSEGVSSSPPASKEVVEAPVQMDRSARTVSQQEPQDPVREVDRVARKTSFYGASVRKEPASYDFGYTVASSSGVSYGHQETRDGYDTKGSYYVPLPDGRVQKVTYYVSGDSGYVAQVSYEGRATYPPYKPAYRPTPIYKPKPLYA